MKNGLYHKDIYMPKLNVKDKDIELAYTYHAICASETDKYEKILLPSKINVSMGEMIEIEVNTNKVIKLVVSMPYNSKYNLFLVILPDCSRVKTVWLNEINDKHMTLDRSKYIARP